MLIIGLIGGNEANRDQIAQKICKASPQATRFDMRHPKEPEKRANQVRELIGSSGMSATKTLVMLNVATAEEAQALRELGAVFAVVKGQVSSVVPIRKGDLYVTNSWRACRHFLTPEQMYSEAKHIMYKRRKVVHA